MIVCVTGHRPQRFETIKWNEPESIEHGIRTMFRWFFTESSVKIDWFITGMALGVDQWACEEALAHNVPVLAAIPCIEQEKFWLPSSRAKYHELLSRVQAVEYVTREPYRKEVMQVRNMWMVDRANMLVAVFTGTAGGTANCVKYAIETKAKRPMPILQYNPENKQSVWL